MAGSARLAGKPPPPAPSLCASCLGHCQRVVTLDHSECFKLVGRCYVQSFIGRNMTRQKESQLVCFLSDCNECIASEVRLKCHIKLSLRKWWILQCFKKICFFLLSCPFSTIMRIKCYYGNLGTQVLSIFVRPSSGKHNEASRAWKRGKSEA